MTSATSASRRDLLKAAALAVVSAAVARGQGGTTKPMNNIKLGIFTSVYAKLPLAEAARRIKADGFCTVVTDFVFADVQFDPFKPDWPAAKKVIDALKAQDIRIVGLHGYYNVVDPNADHRKHGEARMQVMIENHERLGCNNISTETGTLNKQSEWADSPENATEEAYAACRDTLAKTVKSAEKAGAIISIETYWKNIISSIERTVRLFADIPSPSLKLVMDPCNYYRKADLPRMQPILKEMFAKLADRIIIAHAKDVKAAAGDNTDLPAAGRGVMDYDLFLRLLKDLGRDMPLLIEHLTLDDVPRARDYVLSHMG